MDALAGLLDGPRARRAFLLRCTMAAPWAIAVRDEAPLSVIVVRRGHVELHPAGGAPVGLDAGDVVLVQGPDHYVIGDDLATAPQAIIHPDQSCTTPDGQPVGAMQAFGVRRWGNATDGDTELLTGTYSAAGEVGRRLLDAVPPILVLRRGEWDSPITGLLTVEMDRDAIGQDAVLDRLLDLLLIDVVRTHLARAAATPGWYRAQQSPAVARAVRLMQEQPATAWSLATLARATDVSRATLARRFAELVGQPPMEFLTHWRMALAADLILDPEQTVASVARAVGYGSPYALSAAFKRVHGHSPQQYRTAQRAAVG